MQSAPVSDSLEGPKRRYATGDAIFGDRFFPSIRPAPPFRPWTLAGPKTFFSETASTPRRTDPHCLWRRKRAKFEPFWRVCGGRGR
jgi:hypothetical protein